MYYQQNTYSSLISPLFTAIVLFDLIKVTAVPIPLATIPDSPSKS